MRSALLLALVLWALPARAADETWSDSDVEAADRYRDQERERAERYRAEIEASRSEVPAPRSSAEPKARGGRPGEGPGARIAGGLRGWFEGVLADLVRALADALRAALDELFGAFQPRHESSRRDLAPREPHGLGAWLGREEKRADDWLAGRPGAAAPAPESVREWQQREAERARELARREQEEARERARRNAALERDERERARWQERWHDADAWREEERARLEAAGAND